MKKQIAAQEVSIEQKAVHPLMKSHTFVSNKSVDYDNLSTFESVSMTAVMVLAILVGVIQTAVLV